MTKDLQKWFPVSKSEHRPGSLPTHSQLHVLNSHTKLTHLEPSTYLRSLAWFVWLQSRVHPQKGVPVSPAVQCEPEAPAAVCAPCPSPPPSWQGAAAAHRCLWPPQVTRPHWRRAVRPEHTWKWLSLTCLRKKQEEEEEGYVVLQSRRVKDKKIIKDFTCLKMGWNKQTAKSTKSDVCAAQWADQLFYTTS